MHVQIQPDPVQKLTRMGDVTLYEPAGDTPHAERVSKRVPRQGPDLADCISHVQTPKGSKAVLKTMVTTACEKNCYYCPFRAGRGQMERLTFKPDELAKVFDDMQRAKLVDGLFLSSGIIKGGITTQDKIIDTVEIIRRKYQYRGYVHLKIMPGAEHDQIYRAMQIADRVSINLEGPTSERLQALAPKKDFNDELVKMLQWAGEIKRSTPYRLASLVTQFVVGAVGDTDLELLSTSERLYRQIGLARAYYSAFNPVTHTPFENIAAVNPQREFRLYQSSFLLRDYGWDVEDLPFVDQGNLRLDVDPKRAWADQNLRQAPVDLVHADREALLRVPGIGPQSADAILKARRSGTLRDLADLRKLGIRAPEHSAPYVLFDGRRPPQQLPLFG
ncbi:MAG: radical SAM protein [Anaerolineae bacterium]|nr:radical SAM protein [Anaerolineae bacterium]